MSKVIVFSPKRFEDNRGWFSETYNAAREKAAGVSATFVQDNMSLSCDAGTVRGIHFQRPPHMQAKLVRCNKGRLIDYVVDLRKGSPTYGNYVSAKLSAQNGRQIFIPEGFGHAFITLERDTEIAYKVNDYYAPDCDGGIRWDCPTINIQWPIPSGEIILSEKDSKLGTLEDFDSPFEYDGHPLELLDLN